jgi:hypothetical protein
VIQLRATHGIAVLLPSCLRQRLLSEVAKQLVKSLFGLAVLVYENFFRLHAVLQAAAVVAS